MKQVAISEKTKGASRGRLLTPAQAARVYGLERHVLYYWLRNRRFSFIRADKKILFWETDLVEFLDRNAIPAAEE